MRARTHTHKYTDTKKQTNKQICIAMQFDYLILDLFFSTLMNDQVTYDNSNVV